jgi:uncharacterized protein YigE (DUF2233 family)
VRRLPLVALLTLVAGCDEAPPVAPQPLETTATGPQMPSACRDVVFEDQHLTDCVADPAQHRIRTALSGPDGTPLRGFAALAGSRGASDAPVAFAVNAGMFDQDGNPIGYFVQDGERLQTLNRNDGGGNFHLKPNGVFFGDAEGQWQVMETEAFYHGVTDRPAFGTQSGPMLVVDGELHPEFSDNGDSLKIRNGVGVDGQGRAHFVLSAGPISFGSFARYFRDEVGARDALFLDGQVSQLWDPATDRLDNGVPIGPMIVVEIRDQGE